MVLVDTSVWITHFRTGQPALERLLVDGNVLIHPFVIGELACGQWKNRSRIISLLASLPRAQEVENDEILQFIEQRHLMGLGVGLIDIHLLASAVLTPAPLWTLDKTLARAAVKAHSSFNPPQV